MKTRAVSMWTVWWDVLSDLTILPGQRGNRTLILVTRMVEATHTQPSLTDAILYTGGTDRHTDFQMSSVCSPAPGGGRVAHIGRDAAVRLTPWVRTESGRAKLALRLESLFELSLIQMPEITDIVVVTGMDGLSGVTMGVMHKLDQTETIQDPTRRWVRADVIGRT